MKKEFSKKWIRSKQVRKQRKYVYNAPLHIRRKMMSVNLSKELREKYHRRSFPVRTGDKVLVISGQFKGLTGKVEKVMLKKYKVYVEKAEVTKRDGSKAKYPIHPSNLRIIELNLDDKRRVDALERTLNKTEKKGE